MKKLHKNSPFKYQIMLDHFANVFPNMTDPCDDPEFMAEYEEQNFGTLNQDSNASSHAPS